MISVDLHESQTEDGSQVQRHFLNNCQLKRTPSDAIVDAPPPPPRKHTPLVLLSSSQAAVGSGIQTLELAESLKKHCQECFQGRPNRKLDSGG